MDKEELISLAYKEFNEFEKPEHSTNYKHCEECNEYNELLKDVDRKELSIEQIGTVCWGPVPFLLPEAMAYYMPRFIELALLNVNNNDRDPYITQFINQIGTYPANEILSLFKQKHIAIVYETYKFINENYREIVECQFWEVELDEALKNWHV